MKTKSKLFLVHLPEVKEPFSDGFSEAFGFWDPLCLGQMILYRSISSLKEGINCYTKRANHVEYDLTNEIPLQDEYGFSDEMYRILFENAEPLNKKYFEELK